MVFLLRPRWLALHAFVIASSVAMTLLGRWQWHVAGQRHGDVRNYAYALQWWLFVAFAIAFWARVVRDARRPRSSDGQSVRAAAASRSAARVDPSDERSSDGRSSDERPSVKRPSVNPAVSTPRYRPYVMPQSGAIVVDDPELAAYNAYLTAIAQPAHISAAQTSPVSTAATTFGGRAPERGTAAGPTADNAPRTPSARTVTASRSSKGDT